MDFGETVRELNEKTPYWGVWAASGALVGGYLLGRVHAFLNDKSTTIGERTGEIPEMPPLPTANDGMGYEIRDLIAASSQDELESRVEGVVIEFHVAEEGYSGILANHAKQLPFFFTYDNTNIFAESGLLPILLNSSLRTNSPIKMDGVFSAEDGAFEGQWLSHRLDNRDYTIG